MHFLQSLNALLNSSLVSVRRRSVRQRKARSRPLAVAAHIEQLDTKRLLSSIATPQESVAASVSYLASVMDQYHNRYPVYDDISSGGNHFNTPQFFPVNSPATFKGDYTNNPHSGATAIQAKFLIQPGEPYGGVIYQNGVLPDGAQSPLMNLGTIPDAGIDLTGATKLTFWARGDIGGEIIDFFTGGVGWDPNLGVPNSPYPDSHASIHTKVSLSQAWTQYTINLAGADLHYVLGGFGWAANSTDNPSGATFYLDDIQFELSPAALQQRLNEPRFLQSFKTHPTQSDPSDALRNSAFTYDNAVALLAFLADGSPDSIRRARLIGDAFVYASQHDRFFTDGRLRSDYSAGDIALPPGWTPHNLSGTVPVPGFYVSEGPNAGFHEIEQTTVDSGNNAWAMIALLALYRKTNETTYLDEARRIGEFIQTQKNTNSTAQFTGFLGGVTNPESAPQERPYASTEHNLDIYAAFSVMYAITGETSWRDDAQFARAFVDSMWSNEKSGYLAGTIDQNTRNNIADELPLDVQVWSILSLSSVHPGILPSIEANFRTTEDGLTGYDFNNDKDGIWPEGTGQVAVAYGFADPLKIPSIQQNLRAIQDKAPAGASGAMIAALHDGLSTGFTTSTGDPFQYFRRPHIGATGWNVFAQLSVDPYYIGGPAMNHPPIGTTTTVTVGRNTGYTLKPADFGFTDPYDNPPNAMKTVTITLLSAYGTLTDNGVALTVNQIVSAADIIAGKLVFTPNANLTGTLFLCKFQLQDDGGTANGGFDLDPTAKVLYANIVMPNHAPVGTTNTVTVRKNTGYTLKTTDFGFSDPNDSPPNALKAVKFTLLSAYGILTDNGTALNVNQVVSAADISEGKLVFTPGANLTGTLFLCKFQVQDAGGTAFGGVDLDPVAKVLYANILNVNHAPLGTTNTVSMRSNSGYTLKTADFGFSDPNDSPSNTLKAVKFTLLSAYGILTDGGVALKVNQVVSAAGINAGKLVFTPFANLVGTLFLSKFQVQDDGGTANGGVDLDPIAKVLYARISM